jgi:hypothetical protein
MLFRVGKTPTFPSDQPYLSLQHSFSRLLHRRQIVIQLLLSSLYLHLNGRCREHSTTPPLSTSLRHASSCKVNTIEHSAPSPFSKCATQFYK